MEKTDWLKDRLAHIRGLKKPNDQQALLLALADLPTRTPADEKKLTALVKAEKAAVRAQKAKQDAANLINAEKRAANEAERKARNHRLIQQGLLFDLAGLENRSRGEMLGLLLAASSTDDPKKWESWKAKGDALLAEVEKKRG